MEFGVILLTIGLYGLAVYVGMRERTSLYIVGLAAGQLSTLASPLWQKLYRFGYTPDFAALLAYADHPLPRTVFMAGWIMVLPALLIIYLFRRHAWYTSYLAALMLGFMFLVYHLLIEAFGTRGGWWAYSATQLPLNMTASLLAAVMNTLITLGTLAALQITRHYTTSSLIFFLLPVPLILRLFVNGLLGAPIYTVLLINKYLPHLRPQSWANTIGVLGTIALLGWAAHVIARTFQRQGQRPIV